MRLRIVMILWMAISVIVSCKTAVAENPLVQPNVAELVMDSRTTLVDVRIPEQFNEKTAKNAVNIPLAEIKNNLAFFRSKEQIVVFCNTGKQAGKAMEILRKNGVKNAVSGKTVHNIIAIQNEKK